MLESLRLQNVGPAPEMRLDLARRLNLITGDNGLGKTLLLDAAWWALTRTWPQTWGEKRLVPEREGAAIAWEECNGHGPVHASSRYDFANATWTLPESDPEGGLVVYLRVDGGVSVHDPLRERKDLPFLARAVAPFKLHVFPFRESEIWNGLDSGNERTCEGLIRDVVLWALQPGNPEFERLAAIVEQLAGDEQFRLIHRVGRVYVDDAREFPFLSGPAGEFPVAHAPAGLRRILGLAYLVVWAWREHRSVAELKKRSPTKSLVLLIDEVESHLHPRWQRTIVPGLIRALGEGIQLQIIATTHSPLVLASLEPSFDAKRDAWFDLDLEGRKVELRKRPYVRQGEVGNWLTSDAFDLKEPRSLEGERAVSAAQDVLHEKDPSLERIEATDKQLRQAGLPDIDRFWVRWDYFVEQARKTKAREMPA